MFVVSETDRKTVIRVAGRSKRRDPKLLYSVDEAEKPRKRWPVSHPKVAKTDRSRQTRLAGSGDVTAILPHPQMFVSLSGSRVFIYPSQLQLFIKRNAHRLDLEAEFESRE